MKLSVARKPVTRNLFTLLIALVAFSFAAPAMAQRLVNPFDSPPPPAYKSSARSDCMNMCRMMASPVHRTLCMSMCARPKPVKQNFVFCADLGRSVPAHRWSAGLCDVKPEACLFGQDANGDCKSFEDVHAEHQHQLMTYAPPPKPESNWNDFFFISLILLSAGSFTFASYHLTASALKRIKATRAMVKKNQLRLEEVEASLPSPVKVQTEDDRLMAEAYDEIEEYLSNDELRNQINREG